MKSSSEVRGVGESSYIDNEINLPGIYSRTFTLVLPAYNEKDRILPVLNDVCSFISKHNIPWKVIVAIDGNDITFDIATRFADKYNFLNIDRSHARNGKGGAIKRILSKIEGEFTILMDADNSIGFNEIIKAVQELEKNDVVILSRYNRNNTIPLVRKFLSRGFNIIVRTLFSLNISDTQSGYKMFRSDLFVKAMRKVTVTNASYDVALLYHVKNLGAKILEIPASYKHAENGKLSPFSMAMSFSISLFALRVRNSPIYAYVPRFIIDLYRRKFRWI